MGAVVAPAAATTLEAHAAIAPSAEAALTPEAQAAGPPEAGVAPLVLKAALDEEMVCEATATATLRMQVVGTATVSASPWPVEPRRFVLRLHGLAHASLQAGALAKLASPRAPAAAAAAAASRCEAPAGSTAMLEGEDWAHALECVTPPRPPAPSAAPSPSRDALPSPFAAVLRYKLKRPRAPPLRVRCAIQPKGSDQALVSIELAAAASLASPLVKVSVTLALPPPPPGRPSSSSGPQAKPPAAWSKATLSLRWPAANATLALRPGERKVFQALVTCAEGALLGPVVTQCECAALLSDANVAFAAHPEDTSAAVAGTLAHRRFRINHKLVLE
jgi:hypothetical protein